MDNLLMLPKYDQLEALSYDHKTSIFVAQYNITVNN